MLPHGRTWERPGPRPLDNQLLQDDDDDDNLLAPHDVVVVDSVVVVFVVEGVDLIVVAVDSVLAL